jgi:hypothetical protein
MSTTAQLDQVARQVAAGQRTIVEALARIDARLGRLEQCVGVALTSKPPKQTRKKRKPGSNTWSPERHIRQAQTIAQRGPKPWTPEQRLNHEQAIARRKAAAECRAGAKANGAAP